jgi:hypothetical protein
MTDSYMHISYEPSDTWLFPIMNRLRQSSSPILRQRMDEWDKTPLSEIGLALATKRSMLPLLANRVDRQLNRLNQEINDTTLIEQHIKGDYAYRLRDGELAYEILLDIDGFIFESRSTYEIVGKFLVDFFERILDSKVKQDEIIAIQQSEGLDTRWIEELRSNRKLFFHNTAPWIAIHFASINPLKMELVILKRNAETFTNQDDYFHFALLRDTYHGFEATMDTLQRWIIRRIEEFEVKNDA